MTGARFVNTHVILRAIYPSGTFSAEKACFSLKIIKILRIERRFSFSPLPLSFSFSPSFFSILIFLRFLFFFFFFKEIDGNNSEEKFYLFSASFDLLLRLV